ncbi:ATP-binding cassette domain-containing protein [Arthrobacter alpinus]|nr:ATP-binding cassette domain-containing protein [Arthrobacter alpinus]
MPGLTAPRLHFPHGCFAAGRTGLVGPNGTGKTALLRLITGELTPGSGTVMTSSNVNYLPQKLTLRTEQRVTDLLGMAEKRRALADVLAGREGNMAENLELIGDDWDLEERAVALLAGYGLPADGPDFLDRTVGTLSGGEAMITALAGLELTARPITLLDEPTNNLDRTARERLYQAVERWRGTLVIATHDRALLERVDAIAELRPVRSRAWSGERVELIRHGGNWDVYEAEVAAEREAAERAVRDAGAQLATEKRQRIEAETKIARRAKAGRKAADSMPKILANELRKRRSSRPARCAARWAAASLMRPRPWRMPATASGPRLASALTCPARPFPRGGQCWISLLPWWPSARCTTAERPLRPTHACRCADPSGWH